MQDFINANFQNRLKRYRPGKFAHSAHVLVQVKSHEGFPPSLTGSSHLRGGTAGFPKPGAAPPAPRCHALRCAVRGAERRQRSPRDGTTAWAHAFPQLGLRRCAHVEFKDAFIQTLA